MSLYNPPAFLDDFARRPAKADALVRGWDAVVNLWFDTFAGIEGGAFYNPSRDDSPGEPDRQSVALRRTILRLGVDRPSSPVWTNVAFDVKGVELLAGDASGIRDGRFRQGMGPESNLGDPRDPAHEGHPSPWVVGGTPANTPEVLVIVGGDDLDLLRQRARALRASAEGHGLTVAYEQQGHVLPGEVEHFASLRSATPGGAPSRIATLSEWVIPTSVRRRLRGRRSRRTGDTWHRSGDAKCHRFSGRTGSGLRGRCGGR